MDAMHSVDGGGHLDKLSRMEEPPASRSLFEMLITLAERQEEIIMKMATAIREGDSDQVMILAGALTGLTSTKSNATK